MKNMFKAFIIMILAFAFLIPMQTIVKASTYIDMGTKSNVKVSKTWTVSFNKPLSLASVNSTNITVASEDNNYIDINVSLSNDSKSVIVRPAQDYKMEKTYTLVVTQNVKSNDGKPLPKEVRMVFITKSAPVIPSQPLVVIDPGHGGRDPGATGQMGTKEKDVVLKISFKIGNILNRNGVKTIYTREIDKTQSLQEKCDVSNISNPNYFVSIHANSAVRQPDIPAAHGIETWYYGGSATGEKLAQAVQTELIKETGRTDRGIKTAGFYVLDNTDATAILVETSFISNSEEEKLLVTDAYQNILAKAIATGILKTLGITNIIY